MSELAIKGQRLSQRCLASRVRFTWWSCRRAFTRHQAEFAADQFAAEADMVSASKRLVPKDDEQYKALVAVRGEITTDWRMRTLPYVEPGMRLIAADRVERFANDMQSYRQRLCDAAVAFNDTMPLRKEKMRSKLGGLYNEGDYPDVLVFDVAWDFPSTTPPDYLMQISPALYEQQAALLKARFEEAAVRAESALAAEFADVVAHLVEKLKPTPEGDKKVFRDSAVENLASFCGRFKQLNITDDHALASLIAQAEQAIQGATAKDLRADAGLRQEVAASLDKVRDALGDMVTVQRRRQWKVAEKAQPETQAAGEA